MANSGRKDPFFRKGGEGLMSKYEPSSRFTYDRERSKNDKDLYRLHELEVKKEREKKYGEHHKLEDGFVGYSNLPKQIYRKSVNEKFEFTLMVVGASGLGKSTLINSLFLTDLYGEEYLGPSHRIHKTVNIESTCVLLHENGVTLKLTIVDTPGFGDYVDNTDCWQPIIEYIDLKYEEYLNDEFRMKVEIHGDKRVHVLLYFLAPTGHSLRPLDIEFMKNLHEKVNIVPLIAKADTMTVEECHLFKKTILSEIKDHKIKIYELPEREDEKENMIQKKLRDRIPFAVVGSNKFIDSAGKRVRGRQYPWGTVEIENLEHSDFLALRCMVIRTHMQDLKDITHSTHYENYRQFKLGAINEDGTEIESFTANSLSEIAKERDNDEELKKIEAEMERVFDLKMKEKTQNMKNSEEILVNRAQVMQKSLAKEQKELKEKWKAFEKEKKAWEDEYGDKFPCFKLKDKEYVEIV